MGRHEVKKTLKELTADIDVIKDKNIATLIKGLVKVITSLDEENAISGEIEQNLKNEIIQFKTKSKLLHQGPHLEEELTLSPKKLKLTLNAAHIGYWSINLKTHKIDHSLLHDQIFGYPSLLSEWTYEMFLNRLHPDDLIKVDKAFKATIKEKKHWEYEFRIHRADDSTLRWIWASGRPVEFNRTLYYLGVVQDVTERKKMGLELLKMTAKFNALFEAVPDCLVVSNKDGNIIFVNKLTEQVFGYTSDEVVGQKLELLIPSRFLEKHTSHRNQYYEQPSIRPRGQGMEVSAKHKMGHEFPVEVCLSTIEDEDGLLVTAAIRDISERKKNEKQLEELAHFDLVTHLPNRVYFHEILKSAIDNNQRVKKEFSLLYLDLDDFKKINDSFGHNLGDRFLEYASKRIKNSMKSNEFVARLGGDEFVVLIEEGVESLREATHLAQRIIEAFQSPYYLDEHELHSSISIGIVEYPSCGSNASTLMKNADLAMYRAKKIGKNTYQFFSDELQKDYERQMDIEQRLRHAIEENEFSLVYQPQFSLITGKIYGYETLLRWNPQGLGPVSPAEFIPIAENMGLISGIGDWVIENACRQFQTWSNQNSLFKDTSLVLSINLSVLQLTQDDFPSTLAKLLQQLQFNPSQLTLEVTETSIMSNLEASIQTLKEIHQLGIGIAIDDFGTGYSSLSYLKKLPFTALKIDQSFVQDVIESSSVSSIVTTIIQLGFGLDLNIIAEGVETEQQLDFLKKAGCHYGQGYFLSYPLPPDELLKFVENQH